MAEQPAVTPMHLAICVSDYDRSVRFYRDALGYTLRFEREGSSEFDPVLELQDVTFREGFMVLGGSTIALTAFESPATLPAPEHAFNRLGITQMAFGVPDLDEATWRVCDHGGTVLEQTRVTLPEAMLVGITDPDGTRLELVQRTG